MAYDVAHSLIVLFGGVSDGVGQNDTWVWDGTNWTQKSPQTSPSAREGPLMAYDVALSQVVMFGGENNDNQQLNDIWVWDGASWTPQSPQNSPPPGPGDAWRKTLATAKPSFMGAKQARPTSFFPTPGRMALVLLSALPPPSAASWAPRTSADSRASR
jgi:hypothetical protein